MNYNITLEHATVQNKLRLLFQKIAQPNYVMDSYYVDNFFNKISCSDPEVSYVESLPIWPELINEAIVKLDEYHDSIKVFLIRMLAMVSEGEVNFSRIISKSSDIIVHGLKEINSPTMSSSLRVAYMNVALALVNHNSGIIWLLEAGVWKEILSVCNEKRTVFVVRQTYKFAASFLWKLNDLGDRTNIKEILSHIMNPLRDFEFIKMDSMSSEEEDEICKTIEPMLQILVSILSCENRIKMPSIIVELVLYEFKISANCYVMLDRMRREDICSLGTKLIFWATIAKIFQTKPMLPKVKYDKEDFVDVSVTYFNIIQYLIQRRYPGLVFDFCNLCNLIWGKLWRNVDTSVCEDPGKNLCIQNQLLVICLVPSLVYATQSSKKANKDNEVVNAFIVKMLNYTCEHTARAAYALRDLILQLDTQTVTLQSVKKLTCLKNNVGNEQANLMFQALFYVLKEYDPIDEHDQMSTEVPEDNQEKVLVMTYVLDTLLALVKNFNINWQESFEVLSLYSVVYNILRRPHLSSKFVMTALNVITLTVKKFLPPNLSLLLETKPGSCMHELGKLIYMKMHDYNWEVRDSALELLLVCTEISYIKFPPFQKQIAANSLINVAATIAFNDHEFYVRVSALKCLAAATRMHNIWEQLKQEFPNILDLLLHTLSTNQEGIVRKEACTVLCEIYQNTKLSSNFKRTLYEHMVTAALNDFHWEVQLTSLKFWRIIIQSLLNDQGMLDGTFPPVTFSRETRKIVTLNEKEIQRRLTRILDELSAIGCLTVLVKLLHDETELDIMECALSISYELLEILNTYKVPENLKQIEGEPATVDELLCQIKLPHLNSENVDQASSSNSTLVADNVIEGILNADDMNLLAQIYERRMNLQNEEQEMPTINQTRLLKFASPYLFVSFLKSKDFEAVIEQKKNWKDGIKSFTSLLDDVLGLYEVKNDINSLDCY
ncbi:uncharacterized protein [Epargyreus clarus]|uniref:uncharacterized protein n=1 Tax=Epargyreus clarus TaxID=520877 RepID=UPI003C2E0042